MRGLGTILAALLASLPAYAGLAPSPTPDSAAITPDPPLIAYANELKRADSRSKHLAPSQAELSASHTANANLRAVTFEMSRHPPPRDEDCAHTLGASRFAEQYSQLAEIHEELGDYEAVIRASKSALACAPREASHQASIASAHLTLGHIVEARAAAEQGNLLDAEDSSVRDVRARIDFIQEHWADATARLRLQVLKPGYAALEDYSRCYLWLAQRRAGVREPELPPKPVVAEGNEVKRWPVQILETLRGELSEAALVEVIRDDGGSASREWLTEALFYVGELRLAEGDIETARRQFATVVNLRVLNFVEYSMARAELAKMRERTH